MRLFVDDVINFEFAYDETLKDNLKDYFYNGASWIPDEKVWVVRKTLQNLQRAQKFANKYGFQIDSSFIDAMDSYKPRRRELELDDRLFPYQAEDVRWIKQNSILTHEPGLGKTVITLQWLQHLPMNNPNVLIICPASVVLNWEREAKEWSSYSVEVLSGSKATPSNAYLHVVSYDTFKLNKKLTDIHWSAVVLDECHYIKSMKSSRAKAVHKLKADHKLALSGTLMPNGRPIELYSVLKFIYPEEWYSWYNYVIRYCAGHQIETRQGKYWDVNGSSNLDELRERIDGYVRGRKKSEVADQLPLLTRSIYPVQAPEGYRGLLRESYRKENRLAGMVWLRQAVGLLKVSPSVEKAEEILEAEDTKVVLFAHHKEVVSQLRSKLSSYGVTCVVGEMSQEDRQKSVREFQTGRVRVMIISTAGGEGINLYSENELYKNSYGIFVERAWNAAVEMQIEGRLHRTGQKYPVTWYYPVLVGTLDSQMHDLIEAKREATTDMFGTSDAHVSIQDELLRLYSEGGK